jgi:hypothetical protein
MSNVWDKSLVDQAVANLRERRNTPPVNVQLSAKDHPAAASEVAAGREATAGEIALTALDRVSAGATATSQINSGYAMDPGDGGVMGYLPANWREATDACKIEPEIPVPGSMPERQLAIAGDFWQRRAAELESMLVAESRQCKAVEGRVAALEKEVNEAQFAKNRLGATDVFKSDKFGETAFEFALANPCSEDLLKRALRTALDQRNQAWHDNGAVDLIRQETACQVIDREDRIAALEAENAQRLAERNNIIDEAMRYVEQINAKDARIAELKSELAAVAPAAVDAEVEATKPNPFRTFRTDPRRMGVA